MSERHVFMVWGALCALTQLDGTALTPDPKALHELRVLEWNELSALRAIRYLVTSTKPQERSSRLLAWLGARADAREVKS